MGLMLDSDYCPSDEKYLQVLTSLFYSVLRFPDDPYRMIKDLVVGGTAAAVVAVLVWALVNEWPNLAFKALG